jgi:TRAP-type C4-dicarboxylate transport system substrate-binding protein
LRRWLIIFTLLLTGCAPEAPPGVTVLSYASPYSPSHPFSRADRDWMAWVERESGGRLRVQPFWSGSVLSQEHSMTELRHGVADIGLITPIYSRGGTHLIRAQAGFYSGARTIPQQVAMYRCLAAAEPQFDRELHGLKVLAVQGGNLPGIITRDRPIRSLDDLQGLRIRAPSELLAVLKHLDADPVDMPMGEVYSALAKGVLDGVIAPADTLKSLHFDEVARYFNTIAIPRGAYAARAMGAERWQSLTEQERALLERSIPVWESAIEKHVSAADRAGEIAGRENGVNFHDIDPAEQARFLEIYERDGEARARSLERFDIDGLATYRNAREIAARLAESGHVECSGSSNESST